MKNKARNWLASAIVLTAGLGLAAPASAAVILSPVSATLVSGTGYQDINDIINQSGLDETFTSGVTGFDTYIASGPMHDWPFSGIEWFIAPDDDGNATVTFDLGAVYTLDAFALWNEDSLGVPSFTLAVGTDGSNFSDVLTSVSPVSNTDSESYPAQRLNFAQTTAQFIRMDMFGCGAPPNTCGIGEVAFRGTSNSEIPEPGMLGLAGIGLFALGLTLRLRRRNAETSQALR